MNEEKLKYFEKLCDILYGAGGGMEKQKAGAELAEITNSSSFANDIEYSRKLHTET